MEKKHYGAIGGLRMIAAFGIVMMHVRANSNYEISGYVYNTIISSFTNFVFLFMTVSAFGMCCGYYDKVLNNKVDWQDFYGKRFKKILPFFGVLVLLDIVMSPSAGALCEAFADLTLLFGFLPDVGNITVIILYSICFFVAGGLIYLYRDKISKWNQWIALGAAGCAAVLYYVVGENAAMCLLVSSTLLICAIINRGGGTGEQGYKVLQRHQYGALSLTHGYIPCD